MRRLLAALAGLAAAGGGRAEVQSFTFAASRIFPGTTRECWVYVPDAYRGDRPACVYVQQDGVQGFDAVATLDRLIGASRIPVTIGVFVSPGIVPAANPGALARYNRSYEYDSPSDEYARFLLEELLPAVERRRTADGRPILLSHRATDRAIGGVSSGAIAAFTAAWQRPDAFSRVFSAIGTYVGLRGGDRYPGLIRKFEPKPLRIFLQDGSGDLNIYGGDWWMANQTMERALVFAGYEVRHVWGEGGHSGAQAAALFAEEMEWLWRGWPEAPRVGHSQNQMLDEMLMPGETWREVASGFRTTDGLATRPSGDVMFDDGPAGTIYRLAPGAEHPRPWMATTPARRHAGQAFGPDGKLYGFDGTDELDVFEPAGATVLARGVDRGNDLVVAHNGDIYVTSDPPPEHPTRPSLIWLVKPDGSKRIVDSGLKMANGIALSPDQTLLYVDDSRSHWVYSYTIAPDGALEHRQRYFALIQAEADDDTAADGLRADRDGRLYVTTRLGVQICDQAGRVNAILPLPNGKVTSLTFGGAQGDLLYAACADRLFVRRLRVRGANAWDAPNKPAAPKL